MSVGMCKREAGFSSEDLATFENNYKVTKDANKALDAVELAIKSDYIFLMQTLAKTGVDIKMPPLQDKAEPEAPVAETPRPFNDIQGLLDSYIDSDNEVLAKIAKTIRKAIDKDTKVVWVTEENKVDVTNTQFDRMSDGNLRGLFSASENTIYLNGMVDIPETTALHEAVHAASVRALSKGITLEAIQAKQELEDLSDYLVTEFSKYSKSHPDVSLSQVSDIYELLSRGLTEQSYQDFLMAVPARTSKGSVWSSFVNTIKNLLGFGKIKGTAFEEFLSLSEVVFEEQANMETGTEVEGWFNDATTADSYDSQIEVPEGRTLLGRVVDAFSVTAANVVMAPTQHLYRIAAEQGLISADKLQALTDKTRAEYTGNQQRASDEVKDRVAELVRNNPDEGRKLNRIMHIATKTQKKARDIEGWNDLSLEAKRLYPKLKAMYKDMGYKTLESIEVYVDSLSDGNPNVAEFKKYADRLKKAIKEETYFPMQRYGKYKIESKQPNGERYVSLNESNRAMAAEVEALRKAGHANIRTSVIDGEIGVQQAAEAYMSAGAYSTAKKMLDSMGLAEDDPSRQALWLTFQRLAKPIKSNLKRSMQRRKFVAGASTDLLRNVESSISSVYRDAAVRKHKGERSKVLAEIEEQVNNISDLKDREKARLYFEEMQRRETMVADRGVLSRKLGEANFMMYLGFNPSSALINLTQNYIVGAPILAAKHGMTRTMTHLNAALAEYTAHLGKMDGVFKEDEARAYKDLISTGVIDDTQVNVHMQLADSNSPGRGSLWQNSLSLSARAFSAAEKANRTATSMSAFRMYMEDHGGEVGAYDAAIAYAHKQTVRIHFDYSEEGKNRLQRGDVGGVLLAFKSYPIQMAYLMSETFKEGLTGLTPEARWTAKKEFVGIMASTFAIGGALALPFASVALLLADLVLDDEDDAYKMLNEWAVDVTGSEEGAQYLLRGMVSGATDTDFSSRVSLDHMIYEIPKGEADSGRWFDNAVKALGGPVPAMISNVPKGMDLMAEGKHFEGLEKMMPKEYSNVSRAIRWGEAGQAHTSYDDLVEEEFTIVDAIKRGLGFSSLDYTSKMDKLWTDKRITKEESNRKRKGLRLAALHKMYGDRRSMREVMREYGLDYKAVMRRAKDLKDKRAGVET